MIWWKEAISEGNSNAEPRSIVLCVEHKKDWFEWLYTI